MADRFGCSALQHEGCLTHLSTTKTIYTEVADIGKVVVVESLSGIHTGDIEQVFHFVENTVVYINITHKTSTVRVGLDEDATLAITRIIAVFHKHVLYACTHL